ncbi:hypothetical protein EMCRGX_G033316 [Ephydatia muelleri]
MAVKSLLNGWASMLCTKQLTGAIATRLRSTVAEQLHGTNATGPLSGLRGSQKVKQLLDRHVYSAHDNFLEFANQNELNKATIAKTVESMQDREGNSGATHVQIGALTVRIRYLTDHMKKNRKDFSCLRSLIQLVHRRRKLLRYLKRTDSAHFQELVRDLSISTPAVQKYPSKKK